MTCRWVPGLRLDFLNLETAPAFDASAIGRLPVRRGDAVGQGGRAEIGEGA
jgi:hypothetical protein